MKVGAQVAVSSKIPLIIALAQCVTLRAFLRSLPHGTYFWLLLLTKECRSQSAALRNAFELKEE